MSHKLRNFEEGFIEGKLSGLRVALLYLKRKVLLPYIDYLNVIDYGQWLEKQIKELENE